MTKISFKQFYVTHLKKNCQKFSSWRPVSVQYSSHFNKTGALVLDFHHFLALYMVLT